MDHIQTASRLHTSRALGGSTAVEAVAGVGAVVLTILALTNIYPVLFASIAVIAVGFAFLVQGIAVSASYSSVLSETTYSREEATELTGGITAEFMGGVAGIVLGILSLIGIATTTLLPVAAIVFGGTLFLGSGSTAQINALGSQSESVENRNVQKVADRAVKGSLGGQLLIGLGSIALGIIAITAENANPLLLSIIAVLSVGAIEFSKGSSLSAKLLNMTRR